MKLENQVCWLKYSQRLKELGVKQESLFYWINHDDPYIWYNSSNYPIYVEKYYYSAFTVAELGEMLPKYVNISTNDKENLEFCNFRFVTGRHTIFEDGKPVEVWSLNYICDTTNEFRNWLFDKLLTKPIWDHNEANARAKMLIYLLENKIIEVKQ